MFARGAFSLFLLLLSWSFPTHVQSQNVTVSVVSTEYIEVTWKKQLQWIGVEDFNVNFTSVGGKECFKTIPCTTVTCTFNSTLCGVVYPCTPTTVTISGGSHTAPTISLVTGPEKMSDVTASLYKGVEYISWTNPSADSSPCYENTTVRIYYNGEESLSSFGREEETTNKALCVEGYGEVEVYTVGGDGQSPSSMATIIYNGSDVYDLVTFETCEPVECTGIEVEWSYFPVCPDVAYFKITTDSVSNNASVGSTNLTVTDLEVSGEYGTCIYAMSGNGKILDRSCHYYCDTQSEVPENLAVEALSEYSIRVTWDPPVCMKDPPITYILTVRYSDYKTTENVQIVGNLSPFTEYTIRLQTEEEYYYGAYVSTEAMTKPRSPNVYIGTVTEEYVDVNWSFYDSYNNYGYVFYYKLTWGKNLQNEDTTEGKSFRIKGFSSLDEVHEVCVAGIPKGREDLASTTDCIYVRDYLPDDGLSGGAVVGIVVASILVAAFVIGMLCIWSKNRNSQTRRRQTQQQQVVQQYNTGIYNPAVSQ